MDSKADLENDLHCAPWIVGKCQDSIYAQNLYAALCNMRWQQSLVFPILTDEYWSTSWRSAGGVVAGLRNLVVCDNPDEYLDWYCSGYYNIENGHVNEGVVTNEIKEDLATLRWHPSPWPT